MVNYEIMIIVDPKEDLKKIESLLKGIFKEGFKTFTKMDETQLAYSINNSTVAHYVLLNVKSNEKEIKDFLHKVNISKTIWRHLVINLDTERAIETLKNMKKFEEWKAKKIVEGKIQKEKSFEKKVVEEVK